MTTPAPLDFTFRVNSISEAAQYTGPSGRFLINLVQVGDDGTSLPYGQGMSLNVSEEEAKTFFPGQTYVVTLTTPTTTA